MTTAPRRARRQRTRQVALRTARMSGCTCAPDIVVKQHDHVVLHHDDWCPMLHHGSQYVIFSVPPGCPR